MQINGELYARAVTLSTLLLGMELGDLASYAVAQQEARAAGYVMPDVCDGLSVRLGEGDAITIELSGEAAGLTEIDVEWGLV